MSRTTHSAPDLFDPVPSPAPGQLPLTRREADLAINDLYHRALTTGDPGAWMAGFLSFIGRMRHYSIFNANLIYMQRPGALAVGTPRYWAGHGRSVRPGAMPIVILAPRSPYVLVYELEDTEGRPLCHNPNPVPAVIGIKGWDAFRRRAEAFGRPAGADGETPGMFRITEEALGTTRYGDAQGQRDAKGRIVIRINQSKSADDKHLTLIHELAHVFCGHLGPHPLDPIPPRVDLSGLERSRRLPIIEFEAEAVAWLLATRAGVDATSPDYLANHVQALDIASLDVAAILHAANRIEPLAFIRRPQAL